MRGSGRLALGIVALAAGLVLFAPATLLDHVLAMRTGQRMRLVDATGWWWHGRAAVAVQDGSERLPVAWRVAFAPLLHGALHVDLLSGEDSDMPTGSVSLNDGVLEVRNLRLRVPAALVPVLAPELRPIALRGHIDVRAPSFVTRGRTGVGSLDATWQRAGIGTSGFVVDLGRVGVRMEPTGDRVAGTIRNTGGDVAIDGRVDVRDAEIVTTLDLMPTRSASDALRAMLPLLGRSDASGHVQLTWRTDWR